MSLMLFVVAARAQNNLWAPLTYTSNFYPSVMYYDTVEDVSYIAGLFSLVNDTSCNIIKWDGSSHVLLPSSPLYKTHSLITYKGKLYAGGYGLASFDGTAWTSLDPDAAVNCFAIQEDKLIIGGGFNSIGGVLTGQVAQWDGANFSDVNRVDTLFGPGNAYITSLQVYKDQLYVGGNFESDNHPGIREIMRFDGTRWTGVGGQIQGDGLSYVNNMNVCKDTLYVAGLFNEAVGSPGNAIAAWDGSQWHRLNNGLTPNYTGVSGMTVINNELYVSGTYFILDGIDLGLANGKGLAKWTNGKWCSLGTHASSSISNLGKWREELYILGAFLTINGQPIAKIARWTGQGFTDTCSSPTLSLDGHIIASNAIRIYPNPTEDKLQIAFSDLTTTTAVKLIVTDMHGRVVQTDEVKFNPYKNSCSLDMQKLLSGIYLLDISTNGQSRYFKIVKR